MYRNRHMAILFFVLLLALMFLFAGCGGGGGGGQAGPTAKPGSFNLVSPGDSDIAIQNPTLSWTASSQAASYQVQIASSPSFTAIVLDRSVTNTSLTSSVTLTADTTYAWRVTARNSLGATLATASTKTFGTFTVKTSGGVVWAKTTTVADQDAQAFAMAIDGTSMYVVGYDFGGPGGDDRWRIEKRSLATGNPDSMFGAWQGHGGYVISNPGLSSTEDLWGVAVDSANSRLILAGSDQNTGFIKWRIEQRDLSTGALVTHVSGSSGEAYTIATDSTGMFVGGYDFVSGTSGTEQWRIERRNLATGDLVWLISGASVTAPSAVNGIAVDETHVYAAGYYAATETEEGWYIEIRNKSNGNLVTAVTSSLGSAKAIAIDNSHMYVVGYDPNQTSFNTRWHIEKRSLTDCSLDTFFGESGILISNPSNGSDVPNAIASDGVNIYVAGYSTNDSSSDLFPYQWHIEKYAADSGLPVDAFGNNGTITRELGVSEDEVWAIAVNNGDLYLAGYDSAGPGATYQWRIEKRVK